MVVLVNSGFPEAEFKPTAISLLRLAGGKLAGNRDCAGSLYLDT